MFDQLEIRILPAGPRLWAQLRFWVNGVDLVAQALGPDGYGPLATDFLRPGRPNPLRAAPDPRRVHLGEPECTGGCCGYLSALVQRVGNVVQWSAWEAPDLADRPTGFDFDATAYDAEIARAEAEFSGRR